MLMAEAFERLCRRLMPAHRFAAAQDANRAAKWKAVIETVCPGARILDLSATPVHALHAALMTAPAQWPVVRIESLPLSVSRELIEANQPGVSATVTSSGPPAPASLSTPVKLVKGPLGSLPDAFSPQAIAGSSKWDGPANTILADVDVLDVFGSSFLSSLQRARSIASPAASVLPAALEVHAVLVQSDELARLNGVGSVVEGFDISAINSLSHRTRSINLSDVRHKRLTRPTTVLRMKLDDRRQTIDTGEITTELEVFEAGAVDAMVIWHTMHLSREHQISTAPHDCHACWARQVAYFVQPVQPGELDWSAMRALIEPLIGEAREHAATAAQASAMAGLEASQASITSNEFNCYYVLLSNEVQQVEELLVIATNMFRAGIAMGQTPADMADEKAAMEMARAELDALAIAVQPVRAIALSTAEAADAVRVAAMAAVTATTEAERAADEASRAASESPDEAMAVVGPAATTAETAAKAAVAAADMAKVAAEVLDKTIATHTGNEAHGGSGDDQGHSGDADGSASVTEAHTALQALVDLQARQQEQLQADVASRDEQSAKLANLGSGARQAPKSALKVRAGQSITLRLRWQARCGHTHPRMDFQLTGYEPSAPVQQLELAVAAARRREVEMHHEKGNAAAAMSAAQKKCPSRVYGGSKVTPGTYSFDNEEQAKGFFVSVLGADVAAFLIEPLDGIPQMMVSGNLMSIKDPQPFASPSDDDSKARVVLLDMTKGVPVTHAIPLDNVAAARLLREDGIYMATRSGFIDDKAALELVELSRRNLQKITDEVATASMATRKAVAAVTALGIPRILLARSGQEPTAVQRQNMPSDRAMPLSDYHFPVGHMLMHHIYPLVLHIERVHAFHLSVKLNAGVLSLSTSTCLLTSHILALPHRCSMTSAATTHLLLLSLESSLRCVHNLCLVNGPLPCSYLEAT